MKKMYISQPEEPFSGVGAVLAKIRNNIRPIPSAPSSGSGNCSLKDIFSFATTTKSRKCYEEMFKDVIKFAEYLGELVLWAYDTLRDLIN